MICFPLAAAKTPLLIVLINSKITFPFIMSFSFSCYYFALMIALLWICQTNALPSTIRSEEGSVDTAENVPKIESVVKERSAMPDTLNAHILDEKSGVDSTSAPNKRAERKNSRNNQSKRNNLFECCWK